MSKTIQKKFLKSNFFNRNIAIIALILLLLLNCLFTNNFISTITFTNLMKQASKVTLVGLGMTLVIATGGIDISVGSAMSLGAIISANFFAQGNILGAILSLAVVAAFGLLSGVLISKLKVLPMIATLSLWYMLRGMAKGVSGVGTVSYSMPGLTSAFVTPVFGIIPIHFFIIVIAVALMYIAVNRMKFGVQIEAYGNNPTAARICGVNTTKIIIICYVICAVFAWFAGQIEMIMVSSADPSKIGLDMEIDAIAATVIGGTPITGGYPNIAGTVAGAFLLQLITMMCNMNNIAYSVSLIIKAGIIILGLCFHSLTKKNR